MIKNARFGLFNLLVLLFASLSAVSQDTQILADSQVVYTDLTRALQSPEKVYQLRLKKKKLKQIPSEVFTSFPNLSSLDLSHNLIDSIPASLGNLVNLKYLNLSHNKISLFPAELGSLAQLQKLVVNNNNIEALPSSIGNLQKLEYIDLWSNELGSIPEEIKNISGNLKTLDLRAILFDIDQQKKIRELLPKTRIFFSPGCNCGK